MLLSTIAKQGRTLRNLCLVRNYRAARQMAECHLDPATVHYRSGTRAFWVPELGITLGPAHHIMLAALWQALALKRAGVSFSNNGNEILAHTSAFSVAVENEDELFILREVVANGVYNVIPSAPGAVVLDVGMNVGFASLQFAAQPWVEAVWAYEPVAATYRRALANFCRNPGIAAKIRPHNYGLNDSGGKLTFNYSPAWRGAVGLQGLTTDFRRHHRLREEDITTTTVEMRSAGEAVRQLRNAYPAAQLIVKMDCEGCEYRLIASLQSADLLRQVDVFLLERHGQGAAELVQTLTGSGFAVLPLTPAEATGMIYAFRQPGR